ncbi:MAG: hypothetical protein IPL50_21115 [Chitinophagaceae bacterium]|nr:hypothetical protein [Chitinophagaceae bacterium]
MQLEDQYNFLVKDPDNLKQNSLHLLGINKRVPAETAFQKKGNEYSMR